MTPTAAIAPHAASFPHTPVAKQARVSDIFTLLVQELGGAFVGSAVDDAGASADSTHFPDKKAVPERPKDAVKDQLPPGDQGAGSDKPSPKGPGDNQAASVAVPVQVVAVPLPSAFFRMPDMRRGEEPMARLAVKPQDVATPELAIHLDAVVQIRLRSLESARVPPAVALPVVDQSKRLAPAPLPPPKEGKTQPTENIRPGAQQQPDNATPERQSHPSPQPLEPLVSTPERVMPDVSVAKATPNSAPPVPVASSEVPVRIPHQTTYSQPVLPPAAGNAGLQEAMTPQKDNQQPLRSVSLEFTPDGAGDIKLRLSERGGEIHISLHSNDSALSGRLHEGVQDLVGSLSKAGYEAEAWTSNRGQQNHQPPEDRGKPKRDDTPESGTEDFTGVFQQSNQEAS